MYRVLCWPSALLAASVLALVVSRSLSCPRSCNCYQTNEVHCTFRSLLTVPPGLPTQTRRINLGFNSIRRLQDKSLSGLRRVELLMLHSNDLHHLPDAVFRDMKSLQILKLSYNKLREISSSLTFSGLTSLLRLYLDHNLLQHIHPRALLQLPSLRLLRLQGNRLHQLHPHTLCTLSLLNTYYFSTLRHLDLSNNSLTTLPKDSLATAPLLETLILHANPWSCDCRVNWFLPWSLAHPGIMKCPNGPQCPVCALPTSLQGQGLLDQPAMPCSSPVIHSPGKETFLETDLSEIQSSETFREPLGSISLGLSDQQGNSVDLSCNITQSDSQELTPLPDQSVTSSSPITLTLSLTLECFMREQSYEKLWRILAYYSESAAQLQQEIMLSKAPELAYRYKQAAETTGYYHTGVKASVKAKPYWLLQSAIGIQLNRAQSSRHKVQLIYSTKVSTPLDLISNHSASSLASHPWVLISTNNSFASYVATLGSNIELSCPILSSGNPKVWWVLPDGSKIIRSSNKVDGRLQATASGLFLQKVQLSDAGIYYCVAEAGRDVDVLPLRLAVEESSVPHSGELVGPPATATVGETVNLSCKMSGSPQPEISWILPDRNILRRGLTSLRELTIQSNGSLTLLNPSPRDVGHYRCIGVNLYGSDSLSFPLKLNPQQIMPLETLFPKGPQSASGRSTKIRAPLFHQAGEGSGGDMEQEEPRVNANNKQRPVLFQSHPQRRHQGEKVPHGPMREGPFRGRRPISPTERKRSRFQNRNRGSTNRLRLDPQKWADLLAKIRQKTANISNSQLTNKNPTDEPKQGNEVKKTSWHEEGGGEIKDRAPTTGAEAETEGSSEDDAVVQDKMSQPVQFPHADPQIKTEITTDAENDIEMPTRKPVDSTSESYGQTQTEKANTVTKTPSIPLSKKEPIVTESNPAANEIVLETKEEPKQRLYSRPGSTWPRHRLPPNLVPNFRNQSHWNLQRQPGKRRRIGRPRIRPGTLPQSSPNLMRPRPQAVTPDSIASPTSLLQTVPTTTFMPVLLTTTDQIDTSTNDPSRNSQYSPSVSPTSDSTAPPLSPIAINRSTFTDPVTQPSKTSQNKESTLNNKPALTLSKTVISEKREPDTHDATFTHGLLTHAETKTASSKSTEIPISKHSKNLEGDILDKSHFSTTHSFNAFSVSSESSDLPTARTIMRNTSAPPKRASYDGSTSGSLTNENSFSTSRRTTTKTPFMSAATNIVTPTATSAMDGLSSDTTTITSTTTSTSVTSTTHPIFTISTTGTSASSLSPIKETFSTTSGPRNSRKDGTVSMASSTISKEMTTVISTTTNPLVVETTQLNTIESTRRGLSSTAITTTTTSPRSSSRNTDEVDPRGSPASAAPVRNPHPTDWKSSGANSIPDSHKSRYPHPTSALLPAAPLAPAVSSRPRIADPHTRRVSFPAESIAMLACEAEGQPKPSITWTKVATGAMMSIHSRGQRFEVLPNGTLAIKNVQPQDRGTYICSANNFLGRDRLLTTLEVWTRPPRMKLESYREVTIHQGGEVHLECQADGVPSPRLSWVLPDRSTLTPSTRSDRVIMNTNATLFISATVPSDRGMYRCVASNSAGAASASVRVHVSSLPPVIQQPRKEHLLLSPGMPVFAHCFARGAPPPTLRWRIPNGTLVRPSQFLPGNLFVLPNGTLHIRSVESRDTGDYECTASNAMGSAKRTVRVEVTRGTDEKRRQGKIPNVDTKGAVSENTSFSSKKGVLPIPSSPSDALKSSSLHPTNRSTNLLLHTSSWNTLSNSSSKFNKTFIASPTHFTNFRKTNHSLLSPSSTVPTHKTNISPNINTTRVPSSFPAARKAPLHPLPVSPFTNARIVSTSPPTSSIPYGGVLQLHCTTTGNPIPVIIWRTPSRKLVDMNYSFDRRLKVHPNGTLSVQAVRQTDAGDYLCIARNKVADDYRLLRVTVATKPAKIEPKQPLSHMVLYGKPLKVDCQAFGLPDPVVQWSLPDGTMVNSVLNGEGRGLRSRRLTVFDNGTLLVPAVGIKEEGEYTCYAENQEGQDTMKVKVKVTMTSPPTFTEDRRPSIIKAQQGATVTIPCLATGNPVPKVMWFSPTHRAIPQSLGSGFYSGRAVVVSDGTLQIRSTQKGDSGNYTCRAINSVGERSKVVSLDIEAPTYGLYGQTGERGWSINQHGNTQAIRPGDNIDNPRITGHRFISNKLHSTNNTNSNTFGRTRYISPNNGVNVAISGFYPTLRSDVQRGFNRLISGGNTGIRFAGNKAQDVGIKEDNSGIKSSGSVSSSRSGNSHETIRGQTGESKPETVNNELAAERISSDGSTSRDSGRLNDISRNVGNLRVSFSSQKSDPRTLRGNYFSRNSGLRGTNDNNRRDGVSGHTDTVVGVATTTKKQAVKGQTVLLPCPYRGSPPLRQAWLLPGNGMLPAPFYGSRLVVHRNGSLEIRGVQMSDGGTLVCVVTSKEGETVTRVELEISEPRGEFRLVQTGLVQEKPQPLSPLYLQRGVSSPVVPQPVKSPPVFGPVSEPKVSYRTAPLVSIISGETLRLTCPVSSSQAFLSWTTPAGKVLSRGNRDDSGRFILQEDRTLTVNQASVFDRGTYTCRSSTNDSSTVSVVTVPVIVIAYPPRITKGPSPMTYTHVGVAVELPCLTIATPKATVTWETPDLTQLRMMGQPRIYGNNYLSPQGSLVIQNPTHRDTGFYKCTAKNVIGTDSKATYLHVI
ncbi:Matrix-remodeling-associated protein 5 [Oryzias melastigma]|uniref:Matrix-remodeling-associated protein 5 n=1 Tax=Oryzias melastigma TaxID=30732 RepID=A0A834BNV5_ORYME|nr:Matrix-remodeling-associated protein 5 [Oryzias melastigma]